MSDTAQSNPTSPQLHSLARMMSQRQLNGGYVSVDWNEATANYVLRVAARGTKQDLLTAVDRLRCELDIMYYQVKSDILKEYAASGDRIGF